jgi:hypothetical protein
MLGFGPGAVSAFSGAIVANVHIAAAGEAMTLSPLPPARDQPA